MLRSALVSVLEGRLGQRSGTTLDNQIIAELQLAQTELESSPFLPWFLQTWSDALTFTALTRSLTLPSGYIREAQVDDGGGIYIYATAGDTTRTFLEKKDIDLLLVDSSISDTGTPAYYATVGQGSVQLFPTPDIAYTGGIIYMANDTSLATDISNNWTTQAAELMIAQAGLRIAQYLRDQAMVALFSSLKEEQMRKLIATDAAQREAGRQRRVGGNQ